MLNEAKESLSKDELYDLLSAEDWYSLSKNPSKLNTTLENYSEDEQEAIKYALADEHLTAILKKLSREKYKEYQSECLFLQNRLSGIFAEENWPTRFTETDTAVLDSALREYSESQQNSLKEYFELVNGKDELDSWQNYCNQALKERIRSIWDDKDWIAELTGLTDENEIKAKFEGYSEKNMRDIIDYINLLAKDNVEREQVLKTRVEKKNIATKQKADEIANKARTATGVIGKIPNAFKKSFDSLSGNSSIKYF